MKMTWKSKRITKPRECLFTILHCLNPSSNDNAWCVHIGILSRGNSSNENWKVQVMKSTRRNYLKSEYVLDESRFTRRIRVAKLDTVVFRCF